MKTDAIRLMNLLGLLVESMPKREMGPSSVEGF